MTNFAHPIPPETDLMRSNHPGFEGKGVAIIGAGTIGRFMALEAALSGHDVYLIDKNDNALEAARTTLEACLEQEAVSEKERPRVRARINYLVGEVHDESRIQYALQQVGYVIEALPEIKELKGNVLKALSRVVSPQVPLMTMSSSISAGELCRDVSFPERVVNAHPLQRGCAAVEIMPSAVTSTAVTERVSSLFSDIGMIPIDVQKENIGFIFNIAWRNIKKTALDLVQRGVSSPEDFDRIWMMAFKTSRGPFGVMDSVGLDVVLAIEDRYANLTGKEEDRPPQFLRDMVDSGKLGLKTRNGFYTYPNPAYARPGFLERGGRVMNGEEVVPTRDTLIGTWDLVSFTATKVGSGEIAYPMGRDARGKIMYSADGSMSVALVCQQQTRFSQDDPLGGALEERAQAYTEYFSYYGGFRYRNGIVFHDVEACSFPNWGGCTLMRHAVIDSHGYLLLSTPPVEVAGSIGVQTLTWKRK